MDVQVLQRTRITLFPFYACQIPECLIGFGWKCFDSVSESAGVSFGYLYLPLGLWETASSTCHSANQLTSLYHWEKGAFKVSRSRGMFEKYSLRLCFVELIFPWDNGKPFRLASLSLICTWNISGTVFSLLFSRRIASTWCNNSANVCKTPAQAADGELLRKVSHHGTQLFHYCCWLDGTRDGGPCQLTCRQYTRSSGRWRSFSGPVQLRCTAGCSDQKKPTSLKFIWRLRETFPTLKLLVWHSQKTAAGTDGPRNGHSVWHGSVISGWLFWNMTPEAVATY